MANVINTPLMNLPNPVPSVDPGPDYAENIQSCFDIIDGHNHSAGSGNQINTSGIQINADFPLNNFNETLIRSARFTPQVAPLSDPSDLGCLYESGVDLWYNDGNGNQVQITAGGLVNATSSGISSPPASAAFVGSVLVVNENTNTPANIQVGSVLIGNNTVSSNFVTVSAPTALASNYNFVLPTALPGSQKFMTLDASGNLAAPWAVDNSTIEVSGGATVQVKDGGITTAKLAALAIDTAQLADGSVTAIKLAAPLITYISFSGVTTSSTSAVVSSGSITYRNRPVRVTIQGPQSTGLAVLFCQSSISEAAAELALTATGAMSGTIQNWRTDSVSGGALITAITQSVPLGMSFVFTPTAGAITLNLSIAVGSGASGTVAAGISAGTMVIEQL